MRKKSRYLVKSSLFHALHAHQWGLWTSRLSHEFIEEAIVGIKWREILVVGIQLVSSNTAETVFKLGHKEREGQRVWKDKNRVSQHQPEATTTTQKTSDCHSGKCTVGVATRVLKDEGRSCRYPSFEGF